MAAYDSCIVCNRIPWHPVAPPAVDHGCASISVTLYLLIYSIGD